MQQVYDKLISLDADAIDIPNDYYTTLREATERV
jgi:hypothetical protein